MKLNEDTIKFLNHFDRVSLAEYLGLSRQAVNYQLSPGSAQYGMVSPDTMKKYVRLMGGTCMDLCECSCECDGLLDWERLNADYDIVGIYKRKLNVADYMEIDGE